MQTNAMEKISARQFTILIILGIIGDSILVLPTMIAYYAKQDSWISMLLSCMIGLGVGVLFAGIANRLKGKSLITAVQNKFGIVTGSIITLLILFQFFMCSLTLMSEMSQFMTTQMMPETPVSAILLLFSAVIIIAYRYGIEAFARMGELLFPVFLILFLCLVFFLMPQIETTNAKPILPHGMGPVLKGMFPAFTQAFTEIVFILMLTQHVHSNTKLTKPILTGYAIGGLILLIVVSLCVLVLGPMLMETKYYPAFVLAQKITIGKFLERLEVILTFLWIITVFFKSTMIFFALTNGLAQLLRLKESRMLTIPLSMIIIVCTISSTPNITIYNQILLFYYPWFDLIFCLGLPLLFFVILLVPEKRKKGSPKESEPNDKDRNTA
ncbi:GerAB/ArcD/ProY family transporter [Paenibacillus agri]|uniref:Endospore germination permease n=1 Tax=Paenibacillus agri TaxID=2744309 RepID=A0A850ETG2_9BACL|nr:endospore germination permease [Paenibacillus agri]NUU62624.1 endospore germination permease [Paenibacillus agri]